MAGWMVGWMVGWVDEDEQVLWMWIWMDRCILCECKMNKLLYSYLSIYVYSYVNVAELPSLSILQKIKQNKII